MQKSPISGYVPINCDDYQSGNRTNEKAKADVKVLLGEKKKEKYRRYLSMAIMMFSMLVSCIGFSIIFGSVWPYYQKIDDSAAESFLGFVVAAFSFGQLLTSPLIGVWSSYRPIKEPLIITLIVSTSGNLLYSYAEAFEDDGKWILMLGRFIMGLGAGNIALARSYMSAATLETERNAAMSLLASMQALGFILGPALGLLFQPLGDGGVKWHAIKLYFNLYTGPGFLGVLLNIVNILVVVLFFKEYNLNGVKRRLHLKRLWYHCLNKCVYMEDVKETKPLIEKEIKDDTDGKEVFIYGYDNMAAFALITIFFLILVVFAVLDTLLAPLAEDEYAWDGDKATFVVNLLSALNAIISMTVFLGTSFILKWVPERFVFISGLILMIIGAVIWLPLGPDKPDIQLTDLRNNITGEPLVNSTDKVGCDYHKQSWCLDQPKIYLIQYIVGLYILTPGYCASSLICYTTFSKILGPRPQGLMMGLMSAAGSGGRTVGPLLLANVYYEEGPRTTFLMCIGITSLALIILLIFYRRIVPYSVYCQRKVKWKPSSINADPDILDTTKSYS